MRISLPTFNSYSPMYLFGASQLAGNSIKMNFMPWQVGHAFLSNPIQLLRDSNTSCQSATFNVSFAFNVQNGTNPLADGFTFQIVSSNTPLGRRSHGDNAGGNLGLRLGGDVVRPGMIAVEFDNYNNGYENGDLDDNHVAVDVDFTQYSVYSINANSFKIDLRDGKPKNSWIDYDGFTNILRVFLSYSSSKPSKPILAYPINLCQVLRPEHFLSSKTVTSAYFGFSGATGGAYQSTDVWKFSLSTTWATSSTPKPGKDFIFILFFFCYFFLYFWSILSDFYTLWFSSHFRNSFSTKFKAHQYNSKVLKQILPICFCWVPLSEPKFGPSSNLACSN